MTEKMTVAPIALFVYNRLLHTQQTVKALQKNELADCSHLFIFADISFSPQNVTKHIRLFNDPFVLHCSTISDRANPGWRTLILAIPLAAFRWQRPSGKLPVVRRPRFQSLLPSTRRPAVSLCSLVMLPRIFHSSAQKVLDDCTSLERPLHTRE